MSGRRVALAGALLASLAPVAAAVAGDVAAPRPQDSLYGFVNDPWEVTAALPADGPERSTFDDIRLSVDERLREQLQALGANPDAATGDRRKLADLYRAYVDTEAIDRRGTAVIAPALRAIEQAQTPHDIALMFVRLQGVASTPLLLSRWPGNGAGRRWALSIFQDGLVAAGDWYRAMYDGNDPRKAQLRLRYRDYARKLFELAGDADAAAQAELALDLETRLARIQVSDAEERDASAGDHEPLTLDELAALAPAVDWRALVAAAGHPELRAVQVPVPRYLSGLSGLLRAEPPRAWRAYLKLHRLDAAAAVLPQAFRDARDDFRGHVLNGALAPRPRWRQAMLEANGAMRDAVGGLYAERWLPPAARQQAQHIAEGIRATLREDVRHADWMVPATRDIAAGKLDRLAIMIGVPPHPEDYAALRIDPSDAFGNQERAGQAGFRRDMALVGRVQDRLYWGLGAHIVNAYYDPDANAVVLPAAVLQPPFFDVEGDLAANEGAFGALAGTLMAQSIFGAGSEYDAEGHLHAWWQPTDRRGYSDRVSPLVAQFDAYEPRPGKHVDGRLTLEQNVVDLAGLQAAYQAYEASLGGRPSPVIDGVPGEQRLFIAWARMYRAKVSPARLDFKLQRDPHAPGQFRVDGAAVNTDGFHDAFGTRRGDGMWREPADRVHLW